MKKKLSSKSLAILSLVLVLLITLGVFFGVQWRKASDVGVASDSTNVYIPEPGMPCAKTYLFGSNTIPSFAEVEMKPAFVKLAAELKRMGWGEVNIISNSNNYNTKDREANLLHMLKNLPDLSKLGPNDLLAISLGQISFSVIRDTKQRDQELAEFQRKMKVATDRGVKVVFIVPSDIPQTYVELDFLSPKVLSTGFQRGIGDRHGSTVNTVVFDVENRIQGYEDSSWNGYGTNYENINSHLFAFTGRFVLNKTSSEIFLTKEHSDSLMVENIFTSKGGGYRAVQGLGNLVDLNNEIYSNPQLKRQSDEFIARLFSCKKNHPDTPRFKLDVDSSPIYKYKGRNFTVNVRITNITNKDLPLKSLKFEHFFNAEFSKYLGGSLTTKGIVKDFSSMEVISENGKITINNLQKDLNVQVLPDELIELRVDFQGLEQTSAEDNRHKFIVSDDTIVRNEYIEISIADLVCTTFESLPSNGKLPTDKLKVTTQFQSQGFRFSLKPTAANTACPAAPQIAIKGGNATAFVGFGTGSASNDNPDPSETTLGNFFLTDDGTVKKSACQLNVAIEPNFRANRIEFDIIDIDYRQLSKPERFDIIPFGANKKRLKDNIIKTPILDTQSKSHKVIVTASEPIHSIKIVPIGNVSSWGVAYDNFCSIKL